MKYPLPLKIMGIGLSNPSKRITSSEIEEKYHLEKGWCLRNQGINSRYWVENENNTILGSDAAKKALQAAEMDIDQIDLILCASNSFDRFLPGQEILFKESLGISKDIPCMSLNTGCLNTINALDLSSCLIASGKYMNILIICSLIATKGFLDFNDPMEVSMLADASAAVVVTRTPENEDSALLAAFTETYGENSSVSSMQGSMSNRIMLSKDAIPSDFLFTFAPRQMQENGSKYNYSFINNLYHIRRDMINWVIPNQSTRVAADMMRMLFPKEKILTAIYDYGNIGPVGYLISLLQGINDGKIKRGDIIMMSGVGAGISLSGIVLKY